MPPIQVSHWRSPDEVRAHAPAWDDLWSRSALSWPTARAELLAQAVEARLANTPLDVFAAAEGDRLLAALPLVMRRRARRLPTAGLPNDPWCVCGELLWDESAGSEPLAALARELARIRWPLIWLNEVEGDAPRWRALADAMRATGMQVLVEPRYEVARLDVSGPWEAARQRWSGHHRSQIVRQARQLNEAGGVAVRTLDPRDAASARAALDEAMQLEQRGWKGRAGSSMQAGPAREFLLAQAESLAQAGALRLRFLDVQGQPAAFQVVWRAKGVEHLFKIGYDEAFRRQSPSQVLLHHTLEQLHADPHTHGVDFLGPLNDAFARWRPAVYRVCRFTAAPARWTSRSLLAAYRGLMPAVRRWRRRGEAPQPAACP